MEAIIKLIVFDCHDSARQIKLEIEPGMTKKELAEKCAQAPGVTATAKQIFVTNCIVDGLYRPASYVFTGKEREVAFLEMLVGG